MAVAIASAEVTVSELLHFTDRQWGATEAADEYEYVLFGGARGPGKSYWLRWYSVRFLLCMAQLGFRNVRTMLACEDYPALYERQITKIELEMPPWLGTYHRGVREFALHPQYGSGVICLRNLDDASKYQSAEFALIAVDELTRNPLRTFDFLRGSKRWPGFDQTRFIAATNPNGRHAPWVRQYWIERDFPPEMADIADEFVFVPALPQDNPYLSEDYWRNLETLPDALRRAWLEGDWYASIEGLVYGDFGEGNFCYDEPNPDIPIELAYDDGYIDPRCILFVQRTSTDIYVFDEVWHEQRLAEESVQEVIRRCERHGRPLPELAVGDSSAVELAEHFRRADIPARGGTHDVIEGINLCRRLVCDGQGYRVLRVNPARCPNLVREMTQDYKYPEPGTRRLNEKPLDQDNHGVDALRYWCWLRAGRAKKPE